MGKLVITKLLQDTLPSWWENGGVVSQSIRWQGLDCSELLGAFKLITMGPRATFNTHVLDHSRSMESGVLSLNNTGLHLEEHKRH